MLRNVPQILSPELLKVLSEMGHGDSIVLTERTYKRDCTLVSYAPENQIEIELIR